MGDFSGKSFGMEPSAVECGASMLEVRGKDAGFRRDVAFDSPENMRRDIVLAFVHDCNDERIGMCVFERATKKTVCIPMPENYHSWNLNVNGGQLWSKCCDVSDFPVVVKSSLNSVDAQWQPKARAWVLGVYPDGRLRLVSVWGQIKTVTMETALGFHKQFTLANAAIAGDKLVPKKASKFPIILD